MVKSYDLCQAVRTYKRLNNLEKLDDVLLTIVKSQKWNDFFHLPLY